MQGVKRPHAHPIHLSWVLGKIGNFIKTNAVLTIALLAALITSIIVPPDKEYLGYLDYKTLTCLFCTLAVICALRNIRFFSVLAAKIVRLFKTTRSAILALVYITFLGSMLIANDMALLTFLPLGYYVLTSTGKQKYMAFTFIMQNIAANLGGMLTPFGNPQNLYLFNRFSIPTGDFITTMLPPFCIAVALITLCCLFVKKEPLQLETEEKTALPKARTAVYGVLFALSIILVFNLLPFWVGLIVIPLCLLFLDRKALKDVDYGLLFTFVAFFIFAGNMARIDAVQRLFSSLMNANPLLVSALSCQAISNVPSAILLSQFTSDWQALLVGVNVGGVGTLISSLASLITFRQYTKYNPKKAGSYILLFSAFNFAFLILLTGIEYLLLF
ncbi:MAG: citrate transporter [Clostridiales bacterium]|nr:citrate transporter [Clostridiales bacterium]